MNTWQRVGGIVSLSTGVLGAAVIGGVSAQRRAVRRYRAAAVDPAAAAPYDALSADRSYSVIAADGVVLHVEEVGPEGAEMTVVFAHGWLLRIGAWHYQRLALANERPDLRLVFYDQRSHGLSGRAGATRSTFDALSADLAVIIDTAAPTGRLVLIGHSMGGMALLALAARAPSLFQDRVAGVGLISTAARGAGGVTLGRAMAGAAGPLVRLVSGAVTRFPTIVERSRAGSREAAWLLTRSLGFARRDVAVELVDYLDEMIAATPVEVVTEFLPAFLSLDQSGSLSALAQLPVAIVVGEADRMTPPARSAGMALALPDAELVIVLGAGHMVIMESPAEVNAALGRLLDRAAR